MNRDFLLQRPTAAIPTVNVMTICAGHSGPRMLAAGKAAVLARVALQTELRFHTGEIIIPKREDFKIAGPHTGFFLSRNRLAVARRTTG